MKKGIWVTGTGTAAGPRDECVISAGVEVRRPTALAALTDSAAAIEQVRAVILAAGIPASALETSAVALNPVYDNYPTVAGFTASLGLRITTRDLDSAGALLGQIVGVGGDAARLNDVSFRHSDPTALIAQARDAAWADAMARATQLAGLSGRGLGEVLSVSEVSGGEGPRPKGGRMMMAMADAGPAVTLDAGEGQVGVTLSVRWALL